MKSRSGFGAAALLAGQQNIRSCAQTASSGLTALLSTRVKENSALTQK